MLSEASTPDASGMIIAMDQAILLASGVVIAVSTFVALRAARTRSSTDGARARLLRVRVGLAVLCVIGVVVGYVLTHS